jgi:uncharacterized short protein YbdD (DUF466 family)
MINKLKQFWQTIRRLSGDDAYEQYVLHYQQHLANQLVADYSANHSLAENSVAEHPPLLSREAFFKQWQEKKWTGIKRCC